MRLEDKLAAYLEYCEYRKELDRKTLKACSEKFQESIFIINGGSLFWEKFGCSVYL